MNLLALLPVFLQCLLPTPAAVLVIRSCAASCTRYCNNGGVPSNYFKNVCVCSFHQCNNPCAFIVSETPRMICMHLLSSHKFSWAQAHGEEVISLNKKITRTTDHVSLICEHQCFAEIVIWQSQFLRMKFNGALLGLPQKVISWVSINSKMQTMEWPNRMQKLQHNGQMSCKSSFFLWNRCAKSNTFSTVEMTSQMLFLCLCQMLDPSLSKMLLTISAWVFHMCTWEQLLHWPPVWPWMCTACSDKNMQKNKVEHAEKNVQCWLFLWKQKRKAKSISSHTLWDLFLVDSDPHSFVKINRACSQNTS